MYQGTTIDELFDIVARAEQHARELELQPSEMEEDLAPRLLYDLPQSNSMLVGVA